MFSREILATAGNKVISGKAISDIRADRGKSIPGEKHPRDDTVFPGCPGSKRVNRIVNKADDDRVCAPSPNLGSLFSLRCCGHSADDQKLSPHRRLGQDEYLLVIGEERSIQVLKEAVSKGDNFFFVRQFSQHGSHRAWADLKILRLFA